MSYIRQSTAIICLSSNFGGMELDAIKLAKVVSLYESNPCHKAQMGLQKEILINILTKVMKYLWNR